MAEVSIEEFPISTGDIGLVGNILQKCSVQWLLQWAGLVEAYFHDYYLSAIVVNV